MALTTLAAVKIALGIATADTTQDTLLNQLIAGVSAAINKVTQRVLESATYTEYYSGTGTSRIRLYQYPVTSITSLYLDAGGYFGDGPGAFAAGTLLTAGSDYVLWRDDGGSQSNRGMVVRLGGAGYGTSAAAFARGDDEDWQFAGRRRGTLVARQSAAWPSGKGNIKVTYVAGYSTIPDDLAMAANELAAWYRFGRKRGATPTSEAYDGYSISVQPAESGQWPSTVMVILNRYKKIAL